MLGDVAKCTNCERTFVARSGKTWCAACCAALAEDFELLDHAVDSGHGGSPEAIAEATGLPVARVHHLLRAGGIPDPSTTERGLCTKCGTRPTEAGSDFCWVCRAELYRAFGDAADDLFARLEPLEYQPHIPGHAWGIVSAMNEKRARAAMNRINPTPRTKYSG